MTTDNENQPRPEFFKIEGSEKIFTMFPDGRLFEVVDFDTRKDLKKDAKEQLKSKKDLNSEQVYNCSEEDNSDSLDGRPEIKNIEENDMKEDLIKSSIEVKNMEKDMKKAETIEDKKVKAGEEAKTMPPYTGKKEDTDEEEEEQTDTIEICKKKYDFLLEQAEKVKEIEKIKKEKESLEKDVADMREYFNKIKAKEEAEIEQKRQEKIKKLSKDFRIPEERLKDKSLEALQETEEILDMSMKREKEEAEEGETDMKTYMNQFETVSKRLDDKYNLPL